MQLALNFQLLDAEFFLYAALGKGLDDIAPGLFQGPASVGARIANLDGTIRRIIEEFGYQGGYLKNSRSSCSGSKVPTESQRIVQFPFLVLAGGAGCFTLRVTNFTDSISQHRNRRGIRGMKDEGLRVSRQFEAENRTTSNILSADNEEDYKYNNIRWNWC
ncbi:Uncharacterized protein TCM_004604 [Theobroma cacao]|uniref:Uncharacterized protein n=1 Tax=Theobroma cacao TaxID=3641 RepID=A0A061DYA9_THECC|nr:Uncharacterized protein TCM_004604 [Theobroma cacao]